MRCCAGWCGRPEWTSLLIYPMFVREGSNVEEEIPSMEGQYRYSVDRMGFELERLEKAGVSNVMLFGIPEHKDEAGSGAYAEDGIVQRALKEAKRTFHRCIWLQMYVCVSTLHTDTAECSQAAMWKMMRPLKLLAKTALSHVEAGADMVAPSDMMDGRVKAIRQCLIRQGTRRRPSCPMRSNMHPHSTVPLEMQRGLPCLWRPKDLSDGFPQPKGGHQGSPAGCGRGG